MSSPRRPASSAAASRLTAVLAVVAALSTIAGISVRAAEAPPAEPNDYRLGNYRSPTPQTLKGARVVTTAQAEALWKGGNAVFVDVLPRPPKPRNLPAGTIWHEKPRPDVPGSVWLPDTGYGALAPSVEAYLRAGLEKATHGDRGKALVIYSQRNCWMSWNAAKRAIAIGYANVIWYPDGTDGWSAAGLPLKQATPEPRTAE